MVSGMLGPSDLSLCPLALHHELVHAAVIGRPSQLADARGRGWLPLEVAATGLVRTDLKDGDCPVSRSSLFAVRRCVCASKHFLEPEDITAAGAAPMRPPNFDGACDDMSMWRCPGTYTSKK